MGEDDSRDLLYYTYSDSGRQYMPISDVHIEIEPEYIEATALGDNYRTYIPAEIAYTLPEPGSWRGLADTQIWYDYNYNYNKMTKRIKKVNKEENIRKEFNYITYELEKFIWG